MLSGSGKFVEEGSFAGIRVAGQGHGDGFDAHLSGLVESGMKKQLLFFSGITVGYGAATATAATGNILRRIKQPANHTVHFARNKNECEANNKKCDESLPHDKTHS